MKTYEGLNYSYGTHRVRVTLQDGEFKGSFSFGMQNRTFNLWITDSIIRGNKLL